jgi:low temperature requirement protein LtrA
MVPRATDEQHRAATPLELLFDLCFVVAVTRSRLFTGSGGLSNEEV